MVKVFKTLPRIIRKFAPCETQRGGHKDLVYGNKFRTKHTASSKTDELGSNAGKWRGATGREIFNRCAKNREMYSWSCFKHDRRRGNGNIAGHRINLALCEDRDGAMVVGLVGVLVNQFVQLGAGCHRIQQQNHSHQPGGQGRPAETKEMAHPVLQSVCNLTNGVPPASLIYRISVP